MRVDAAHLLALRPGQGAETVEKAGRAKGDLAGVGVHVERPALWPRIGRGFLLEDGDVEAVELQDAGAGEPAEAGAGDGNAREGHVTKKAQPLKKCNDSTF
ncbi:hypothetical protein GCM10017567_55240 [Amycolatopsis bullii]|uniref:Uncharacterized protein n=1 Tax=Amycolatopsis bullii TaxID=941987 RepID=A0ABQ3KQA8_9PSEU|nr:hypothetical protein GCM10017567_55240 [Amycolatopsis bullii]